MYVYQDHIFYPHAPVSSQIFPTSAIQKCGITPCPCPCGISNQQHPGLISSSWFPLKKRAFSLILEAEEKNHISAAFSCHIKIFSNHLQPSSTPFSSPFPPPKKKPLPFPRTCWPPPLVAAPLSRRRWWAGPGRRCAHLRLAVSRCPDLFSLGGFSWVSSFHF